MHCACMWTVPSSSSCSTVLTSVRTTRTVNPRIYSHLVHLKVIVMLRWLVQIGAVSSKFYCTAASMLYTRALIEQQSASSSNTPRVVCLHCVRSWIFFSDVLLQPLYDTCPCVCFSRCHSLF